MYTRIRYMLKSHALKVQTYSLSMKSIRRLCSFVKNAKKRDILSKCLGIIGIRMGLIVCFVRLERKAILLIKITLESVPGTNLMVWLNECNKGDYDRPRTQAWLKDWRHAYIVFMDLEWSLLSFFFPLLLKYSLSLPDLRAPQLWLHFDHSPKRPCPGCLLMISSSSKGSFLISLHVNLIQLAAVSSPLPRW